MNVFERIALSIALWLSLLLCSTKAFDFGHDWTGFVLMCASFLIPWLVAITEVTVAFYSSWKWFRESKKWRR